MTRNQLAKAITDAIEAGDLDRIAGRLDLSYAAVLVLSHLHDRVPPLRPWQKRAGIEPITKANLHAEILKEFQRLFDQLKTPRKAAEGVAVRYDPAVGLVDGEPS